MYRAQVAEMGEEEHKRRLSGLYNRGEGKIVPDLSCFRVNAPGLYAGKETSATCGKRAARSENPYKHCRGEANQCVEWKLVLNHPKCKKKGVTKASPIKQQIECTCEIVGGRPRPWSDRNAGGVGTRLDGAYPRSLCVKMR